MPQVLKEETRLKIVEAAKKEFLTHGYKMASMRDIANKAEMTVGNVYRYFKNKQELVNCVIEPALIPLNDILKSNTANRVTFERTVDQIGLDFEHITYVLDSIAEELVSLRTKHREELQILLAYGKENRFIKLWVDEVIKTLLKEHLLCEIKDRTLTKLLASSLSESLFAGIRDALDSDAEDEKVLMNIKIYFRLFINMFKTTDVARGVN